MKPSLSLASILCCFVLIIACKNEHTNPGMYNRAVALSQGLDSNALQPFKDWSGTRQGHRTILHRNNVIDSEGYTITWRKVNDSCIIAVSNVTRFQREFHGTWLFDTTKYVILRFASVKGNIVSIHAIGRDVPEYMVDTSVAVNRLFPGLNPFLIADSLTHLMDSLQIISTSYKPGNANGMVFWLSWNRPLVYLPGNGQITFVGKDSGFWKKILPTGKRISKNWLLCDYERH